MENSALIENPTSIVGKNGRGISNSIFTPGFNQIIDGGSKQAALSCKTTPSTIEIHDTRDSSLRFHANLLEIDGNTLVSFVVKNTGWQGKSESKHPDIFPKELMKNSIKYFNNQGKNIYGILAQWFDDPTGELNKNYDEYWDYINSLSKTITPDDEASAAKSTWEGGAAKDIGFPNVKKVWYETTPEGSDKVGVIFGKQEA